MDISNNRYILLGHMFPGTKKGTLRVFSLASGKSIVIHCADTDQQYIYRALLRKFSSEPQTIAEALKRIKFRGNGTKQFALQAIIALVREHILVDVSRLTESTIGLWQNPQPYTPEGKNDDAKSSNDRKPYGVTPARQRHIFAHKGRDGRRSTRSYDAKHRLSTDDIESLLADAYRTSSEHQRPTPSPGGIYPVRLHLILLRDSTPSKTGQVIQAGVYQYDPLGLSLEKRDGDIKSIGRRLEYLTQNADGTDASAYIIISNDISAFNRTYGNASLMFQGITVGIVSQAITAIAERRAIDNITLFGIRHHEFDELLHHAHNTKTVLALALGRAAPDSRPTGRTAMNKLALQKLNVGSATHLLEHGMINFGEPRATGIPHRFVGMWVKHPQRTAHKGVVDGHAFGTATTADEALLKATAEAIERIASANVRVDIKHTAARDLPEKWLDPRMVMPFDAEQLQSEELKPFSVELPLDWTQGKSIATGQRVYAPASMIYYPYLSKTDAHVASATSNGVAAHFDKKKAIENGFLELIERDALMRCWILQKPPVQIMHTSLPSSIRDQIADIRQDDKSIHFLDITDHRYNVPTYAVAIRGAHYPYFYVGAAARLHSEEALHKALEEAIAGFTSRVALENHARQEEIAQLQQDSLDVNSHAALYANDADARAKIEWFHSGPVEIMKQYATPDIESLYKELEPAVFHLDNPLPGNELRIVRVVCPELLPIHFGATGVPYLHHSLPAGSTRPSMMHFFS